MVGELVTKVFEHSSNKYFDEERKSRKSSNELKKKKPDNHRMLVNMILVRNQLCLASEEDASSHSVSSPQTTSLCGG